MAMRNRRAMVTLVERSDFQDLFRSTSSIIFNAENNNHCQLCRLLPATSTWNSWSRRNIFFSILFILYTYKIKPFYTTRPYLWGTQSSYYFLTHVTHDTTASEMSHILVASTIGNISSQY